MERTLFFCKARTLFSNSKEALAPSLYHLNGIYRLYIMALIIWILPNIILAPELKGQCLTVESILVDACAPPTNPYWEGLNEMFRFRVGSQPINATQIQISWANTVNFMPFYGFIQNSSTASKTAALNSTIQACGLLVEPPGLILPANSRVLVITSPMVDVNSNPFTALSDTLYVLYHNHPGPVFDPNFGTTVAYGHFINYNLQAAITQTLRVRIINTTCDVITTYNQRLLVKQDGTIGAQDGATVNFDNFGNRTYINDGCRAPLPETGRNVNVQICPGETYFAGGAFQTQPGVYRDTLGSGNGCDSIIITTLIVKPVSDTELIVNICNGESYFAGGAWRNESGIYRDTLTGSNGCDSIVITTLNVKPVYNTDISKSICQGESYFAGGALRTEAGVYRDTLTASNGCDSIIITTLSIKPFKTSNINVAICPGESYFAGGALRTEAGVYRDTLTASNGCDSILTTTITVKSIFTNNISVSICPGESYFAGGALQTQPGVYRDTLTAANGCDSIIFTTILLKSNTTSNVFVSICPGESYFAGGGFQTQEGVYRDTIPNTNGCDSIIVTNLSVKQFSISNITASICPGDSYFAGGGFQTEAGLYRDTVINANGCDSIIITNLTVNLVSITNVDAAICPGQNYYAGGEMQSKSGTYYDTLVAVNGCDSIIITNLTIKPVSFTNAEASICEGETFFVGGALQNETGIYLDTLTAANGCDSIIITTLTVKPLRFTTLNVSICPGQTYYVGGAWQTEEGVYTDTYTSSNGCDSTVTTDLTFYPAYSINLDTSICTEQPYKGNFYTSDTVIIDSLISINGCDSIIIANLYIVTCCPPPVVDCRDTVIPDNQQYCGNFELVPPLVISQCNIVSLTNDYPGGPFPEGTTMVTWIATDEYGQSDTCYQNVTYSATGSISSYTIVGIERVELMPANDVRTGSVGVKKTGGEAYLQNHTKVTGPGTFVMAPKITTFPNTQVSNPIYAPANAVLPVFERNPHNFGLDVSIPVNTTITLSDTVYGRISLSQGSTVVFDNQHGVLNLREIRVNHKATGANTSIRFRHCMKVRVRERVDLGPKCTVNPDSLAVVFYVEASNLSAQDNQPVVDIGPNALIFADFYVPNGRFFAHPGSKTNPAQYIGTFIAKWITGQPDIIWRRGDCENAYQCQGSQYKTSPQEILAEDFQSPIEIFPNPFRGQTTIGFTLKEKDENVSLRLINATGATVAILYKGSIDAGLSMQIQFNAESISNGMYYAILQTAKGVYSKKLVVMK